MRLSKQLAAVFTMALTLGGCVVVTSSGTTRDPYEQCDSIDTCTGGTACVNANRTVTGSSVGAAFCTNSCDVTAPTCLDYGGSAYAEICVPDTGSTTGQCYIACDTALNCPAGYTCATEPEGGFAYCVPN